MTKRRRQPLTKRETGPAEVVLIRFDRKVLAVLGVLFLLLAAGTAFKLHGSSVGMWNRQFSDRDPGAGILFGTPRLIRVDEWAFITPAIVSQARSRPSFSPDNARWGPARAPLIMNVPVRHWSALVRPQFWGFFMFDLERAFAFYWNMKAFLLLGGLFLLLMLLTGNDFAVSLLGTAWVFFSGFMQWWYSTPAMLPEMVGSVALLLVAAHYMALSPHRWVIVASTLIFSLFLLDSILSLYPAFQVPLLYLGIAILVGSLGPRLAAGARRHLALRASCAIVAVAGVALLLALYYLDARQAIALMRGTLYPGSRMSSGGEVTLAQIFGGLYGFFMSEQSFPRNWFNVCEASNFILLFPVPMVALLWWAWRRQRVTALEWSLMAYIGVVLSWMTLGWPRILAAASAFGLSQGTRSLLGLGLASIVLCCVFLAKSRVQLPGGLGARLGVGTSLLAILVVFSLYFNRATEGFATGGQLALVIVVAGVAGYLLLSRKRIAFAICVLAPSVWSFGLVNPIGVGLGPILETRFYEQISPLVRQDPDARWAVYGSYVMADLLKAAGAQVFNGTKFVPPLEDFRIIDPDPSSASIYNRYAHISLLPGQGSKVEYTVLHGDSYVLKIDPKSDAWRRLGIRYLALPFAATDPDLLAQAALVLALPDVGLWIYKYRWTSENPG